MRLSQVGLALASLAFWPGAALSGPAEDMAHSTLRAELVEVGKNPGLFRRLFGLGRSADDRLQSLIDSAWAWELAVTPEIATYVGSPVHGDRWTDFSAANLARIKALESEVLAAVEAIPAASLSPQQRLNHQLFLHRQRDRVAASQFPVEWLSVDAMNGYQIIVPQVLGAMPLGSEAELGDYLARLAGIETLFAQITEQLRAGLAAAVTPPQVTLAPIPEQLRLLITAEPDRSGLLSPLLRMDAGLPQALRDQTWEQARNIYRESARPALQRLQQFLSAEYIPGARKTTAFTDLPNGQAWYAQRVRHYTTTDLSVADIHRIGVFEVERIKGEMQALMAEQGHTGSIADFVSKLNADPGQIHANAEAQLKAYRAMAKQADGALVKLFRRFPQLPYGIEAVPAHQAPGSPVAYYLPGSVAARRAGVFYVNGLRVAESPRYEMEALLLHEAVPGHHFQVALAQELTEMPDFRRNARFTAYVEGWGLYAESLGSELGFYRDPASRFGALAFEMWRAVRLVVDTGMHALGWTRQQAIDYFVEQTGRASVRVETEVDRYLVYPAQALAYKLGQLKISELRDRAAQELGPAFDLRAFHELVLGAGAMPLTVLETQVDGWIADQKETP